MGPQEIFGAQSRKVKSQAGLVLELGTQIYNPNFSFNLIGLNSIFYKGTTILTEFHQFKAGNRRLVPVENIKISQSKWYIISHQHPRAALISSGQVISRVNETGGNRSGLTGYRSNRSGPVPVWAGTKPAQIQNSNLNSKKMKNSQKIPKNISRCDESNGVKFSQKFIHLV